ncbi:hypothetical protein VAWG006_01400 [Aeromonas enteropelogenes]|nr:hypothetical protein VAWG006_01400 [Aeromonas enteropelogenes]BEE20045.1 hypothetical protein VAWG007_01400 [Aeromonas enteropelogenes]
MQAGAQDQREVGARARQGNEMDKTYGQKQAGKHGHNLNDMMRSQDEGGEAGLIVKDCTVRRGFVRASGRHLSGTAETGRICWR